MERDGKLVGGDRGVGWHAQGWEGQVKGGGWGGGGVKKVVLGLIAFSFYLTS